MSLYECPFLLSRADGHLRVLCQGNVLLQIAYKSIVFGGGIVTVWAGIHRGGRTSLVHVPGPQTSIYIETNPAASRYSTHECQWWNVSERQCQTTCYMCWSGVSAAPQHPDITFACPFSRFKPNRMSVVCTGSACMPEDSITQVAPW